VEPYVISEPFSTAGKINLNQRLVPFSYITRETGLRGVLKKLEFTAIPQVQVTGSSVTQPAQLYRDGPVGAGEGKLTHVINKVDVPKTLLEIGKVLDPGGNVGQGVFRSAAEICGIPLIPEGLGTQTLQKFWQDRQLTGDNTREAPYNAIYPLLTTKSNTFQVHYRVQTLKSLTSKAGFDPTVDFTVTGEQRGSHMLERYLDADDPQFSGGMTTTTPLNEFYEFRVLRHDRFTPNF